LRRLKLTSGLALVVLGAAAGSALAGSHGPAVLSPYDVLDRVREAGLGPTTLQPIRRGPYYVLHAIDPSGTEMRVVADAQLGDILSVRPARPWVDYYVKRTVRGAHVIQVRQGKDANDMVDEAPTPGFARIISVEPAKRN